MYKPGDTVDVFYSGSWSSGIVVALRENNEIVIHPTCMIEGANVIKQLLSDGTCLDVRPFMPIGQTKTLSKEELIVAAARAAAAHIAEVDFVDEEYLRAEKALEAARLKRNEFHSKRQHAVRELCKLLGITEA